MTPTPGSLPSYRTFVTTQKFSALDGLRAVSVLAVVWHHISGMPGPLISKQGFMGVDFFFAISGFLITTLLLREYRRNETVSLRRFYVRRTLRIFPLYYAVLFVYIAVVLMMERNTPRGDEFFRNLPAFLTYTSNWFATRNDGIFYFSWSLAAEEQYYLLWPPLLALALFVCNGKSWGPLLVLAILLTVSVVAGISPHSKEFPWVAAAGLPLPILLASGLAVILNTQSGFTGIAFILGRQWVVIAVFVGLGIALSLGSPIWSIQVAMVVAVASVVISERTWLHPLLKWKPLAFVGLVSYGIYLMHMLCVNVTRHIVHQQRGVLLFFVTVPVVVFVAYLSFRYFETPLLKIKRRFEDPQERDGDEISRG